MSYISHRIYLLLLLIPLVSCGTKPAVTELTTEPTPSHYMCIADLVETSPGIGTIDIWTDTEFSPKLQSIPGVSMDTDWNLKLELPTC